MDTGTATVLELAPAVIITMVLATDEPDIFIPNFTGQEAAAVASDVDTGSTFDVLWGGRESVTTFPCNN